MEKGSYKLNICHLYSEELNLYGDRGNIITLSKRCSWRGIGASVVSKGIGEDFDHREHDIVFLGGGQDLEQNIIRDDLMNIKGSQIREAVDEGVVFLTVCGGYQMMGEYYIDHEGKKMECLAAIPVRTETGDDRLIGNIVCESDEFEIPVLAGFENHLGRTFLGEGARPLARVIKGYGNNGKDGTEGARYKNVFCTYMHGSFLPKNPKAADRMIQIALERKYGRNITLDPLDDRFETMAREKVISQM